MELNKKSPYTLESSGSYSFTFITTQGKKYEIGFIPLTRMIKAGFIIDLIGIFLVTIPVVILLVKYVMGVA